MATNSNKNASHNNNQTPRTNYHKYHYRNNSFNKNNFRSNNNASSNRLMRSFTLFDNRDFLPRPFQIELYEACKSRDTIVFLRPGQGKYFLSAMLVKYFNSYQLPESQNENNEKTSSKQIFFLAKTSDSIRLYSSVYQAHCDLRIAEYLDIQEAKQWSRDEWLKTLQSSDIHLMMDGIFEHLLEQNLIDVNNLSLLILNDVHKILIAPSPAEDCYTRIIKQLRNQQNVNEKNYRILGLSASILLEDVSSEIFEKMIEEIETNLNCSCETYADLRIISKYSIQSRIKVKCYEPIMANNDDSNIKYRLAMFMIQNYSAQFFNFITNVSIDDGKTAEQLINHETIAKMKIDILKVFGTLGEWCTLKLIELVNRELYDTIVLLSKSGSNYLRLLNTTYTTFCLVRKSILTYLDKDIVDKIRPSNTNETKLSLRQFLSISAPKLHLLAKVLIEYLQELSNSSAIATTYQASYSSFAFPFNICSLIYVENRSMARVIDEWLRELIAIIKCEYKDCTNKMNILEYLQPDHVFLDIDDDDDGNGKNELKNFYYRKHQKSLHEIFYYRQQEETLRRFRLAQQCNVLVTTSMFAEGLDVNRCNMVICFDRPKTFNQFIQSKGRVRIERGQFIVFVENKSSIKGIDTKDEKYNNYIEKIKQFCNIEKIFTKLVPLNNQLLIENEMKQFNLMEIIEFNSNINQSLINDNYQRPSFKKTHTNAMNNRNYKKFEKSSNNNNNNTGNKNGSSQTATNIQLTMENSISILNRYCNKLPSDTFTKLVPNYKIEIITVNNSDNGESIDKYRCHLYLPINSTYRDEIIGEVQTTQSIAKQSAAFEAVKTLREIGELDQNYFPIGKETNRYIEKLGLQECFMNVPKIQSSYQQQAQQQQQTQPKPQHHHRHNNHHGYPHYHHQYRHHPRGNRFNRIQNRNIASKRRQYYNKKVADSLCGDIFETDANDQSVYRFKYLYEFQMELTYRLSEEHNRRGRRIIDPAETTRTFGIISPHCLPKLCDFTIYNRSGEVTVTIVPIHSDDCKEFEIDDEKLRQIEKFHQFTFEDVLPLSKSSIRFDRKNGSNGNYLIVPINFDENKNRKSIDWKFLESIWKSESSDTKFQEINQEKSEDNQNNKFIFDEKLYKDAVVIPKYRKDKLQAFYYVAEICYDLSPLSPFPDQEYDTFESYYNVKYKKQITNLQQPLLDVDHTSARLNLLTPRFLNRRGIQHHSSSTLGNQSKRNQQQQKQILVPELCLIHPFPASFWRKAVCLPCILYRLNLLLIAEELRCRIAKEAKIGLIQLPNDQKWPKLDFGWSVLVEQSRQQHPVKQSQQQTETNRLQKNTTKSNKKRRNNTIHTTDESTGSASDFIIDTFDPNTVPPLLSTNDDFSEYESDNEDLLPIEIISGPFSFNEAYNSSKSIRAYNDYIDDDLDEESAVLDVGNFPINDNPKSISVRAGSPTYWKDVEDKIHSLQTRKIDRIDWTVYESSNEDNNSTTNEHGIDVNDYCFDLENLYKDIMKCRIPSDLDENLDDENDINGEQSNFNSGAFNYDGSFSDFDDLDDDDDEEKDYDDDDEYDECEYDEYEDEEDDEEGNDANDFYDADQADECDEHDDIDQNLNKSNNDEKSPLLTMLDDRIRNLSQTIDAYHTKSVIYDILKIELLYDSKQIEQKSLKYYYRHRFSLAEQQGEHIRKRKIFDEMYLDEKKQIMKYVRKIEQQLQLSNDKNDLDEISYEDYEKNVMEQPCTKIDKMNFNQTLIELLMEKIDTNLLDMMKYKHKLINKKIDDQVEENMKKYINLSSHSINNEINNYNHNKNGKIEVKFGELLPNREINDNMKESEVKDSKDLYEYQRQMALQNMPKWLQNEYFPDSDGGVNNYLKYGPHPSLILQAITMSNSSDGINLERLETVGDSFLKYSITAFLFCMCPELNEGKLSFLRSRQISNINLHRLGQRINLGELMIASKFEPIDNWCPPSYKALDNVEQESSDKNVRTISNKVPYNLLTQHSIPNKSIADCVEALIGTFLISSGSQGAIKFMDWLGLKVLPKGVKTAVNNAPNDNSVDDASNQNNENDVSISEKWLPQPRSPLIIPKHYRNDPIKVKEIESKLQITFYKHHLDRFEKIIGYQFRDRSYLVQAFTHNSYYENTVTDCYQRLEFLGDAVLDYLITRYLYEDSRCHSPGTLTDLRSALVNNTFFAALAVKYNFHKYLMMLSSELYRVIDGFVRKFNIYYNQHVINGDSKKIFNAISDFQQGNHEIDRDDLDDDEEMAGDSYSNYNYWELFISENEAEHLEDIEVPKALGDIFESVAGAIYLDSGMSLEAVWKAYYPMMKPEIENFSEKVPKSPIRVLLEKKPQSVKFGKPEINSDRRIRVTVEVFGLGKFVGIGRNKRIAKCTAAKRALRALESEKRRLELERKREQQNTMIEECDD